MADQTKKPKDTPFYQQSLTGFQPVYTPKTVSFILLIAGVLFFAFGFPLYILSESVVEIEKRYDDKCSGNNNCTILINIDKEIPAPVFVYYKLHDFYQNHRLYVRSRSYSQLRDGPSVSAELDLCAPAKYNRDFQGYMPEDRYSALNKNKTAIPCGMVARSVFNDSFNLIGYTVSFDNLVYTSDNKIWQNGNLSNQWRNIDDSLKIWMKISLFSTFRKIFGKINSSIPKGTLRVVIENNYDVSRWKGKKSIVLSNASAFGGKNNILGIIFISAGSFCLFSTLVFSLAGLVYNNSKRGVSDL